MRAATVLVLFLAPAFAACLAPAPPAVADPSPAPFTFAPPVRLPTSGHSEALLAVGPGGRMLACAHSAKLAASVDGGATWREMRAHLDDRVGRDCDVAIDDAGRWFFAYGMLHEPAVDNRQSIVVAVSADEGATWTHETFPPGPLDGTVDRPWLTVDAASVFLAYWSRFAACAVAVLRSDDGGATWTRVDAIGVVPPAPTCMPGDVVIGVDGVVHVPLLLTSAPEAVTAMGGQRVALLSSKDRGATWGLSEVVGPLGLPTQYLQLARTDQGSLVLAYVERASPGHGDVRVIVSTDGGVMWSAPLDVGDGVIFGENKDQLSPVGASIDATSGAVAVAWHQAAASGGVVAVARLRLDGAVISVQDRAEVPAAAPSEFATLRYSADGRAHVAFTCAAAPRCLAVAHQITEVAP